jgi:predicted RNA-binding Zn-ribbon protein involved in translation (DUF1610 family)
MEIIQFPQGNKPEKTSEGEAICRACKHVWEAVAPAGVTMFFECPACLERKGVFRNTFGAQPGEYEYSCTVCGFADFYIFKKNADDVPEVRCRGCGMTHTEWF